MGQEPQSERRDKQREEAKPRAGAERYPSVDRTDSIKGREGRSFEPKAEDDPAPDDDERGFPSHFTGPAADPAEGKR